MYQETTLVGNVGNVGELRYTKGSGQAVIDFSLAVNRNVKRDNEWIKETSWFKVVGWGHDAEFIFNYVKKGRQVLVVSKKIEAEAYLDRQGEAKANLVVTIDTIKLLGKNEEEDSTPSNQHSRPTRPDQTFATEDEYPVVSDNLDDIPF